jgi:hypothetical protein
MPIAVFWFTRHRRRRSGEGSIGRGLDTGGPDRS